MPWRLELSNGKKFQEDYDQSVWGEVMEYCRVRWNLYVHKMDLYVEGITSRMLICGEADGVWQAKSATIAQGGSTIIRYGAGKVFNGKINITWLTPNGPVEYEVRDIAGQNQIIWRPDKRPHPLAIMES